ncbi:peptidase G2 autoproteolytic cleavage domain-containing protein [Bacillus sp. L381]|uniref:peptidase G2 autoproteolytic cleavage domain-containing protein n=1 Tax=Bacillus TaxID=1386 RepID=UPI001BAA94BE|nr:MULTISPECIES: peptidase G2 autoproteolytic cleavage domain-containing protein [Bacillus]MCR9038531.1 peptidase G2 [Bacillus velezensis]QUN07884.1 peptidase G2 [Bacillus amyloliquefaciens]QYM83483.1 peptidase G2 [Bacillus sp. 7D3]QZY10095.1 peptidase G2 [Bacillus amyloliquefaciens]WIX19995.1 peptidase G2 autoproteolytic cleavage domain-containing protein [Bacillus sp. L381]
MGFKLIKDYDTTRNARYIAEQRADAETVENGLNSLENEINSHKKSNKAHSSEQIDHGGFSLRSYIDGLYNRIRNLILNADGTNVKEVVDARVDAEGNITPLLKERLDKEYNKLLQKIKRTVNVDDFGADPTGESDSSEAFKRAIGTGKVRLMLSAGTYVVKGVKLPSWTYMIGQGMGVTTLKLHEDTPASEWVVTNADHTLGNRNIVVEGMSLDWNPERQGGVGATGGIHSSCLTFAQVKFGIIREVEGINPGLHCFDITAPTYDITAKNYTATGSKYIWIDRCVGSGYGDDGITTHYSEYIFITHNVMTNPTGKAHRKGGANSNGIEVDDGSKHVWVIDNYTEGNVRGVEVKAHTEWPAPCNVHIRGHESFRDVRSFDLRHIGHHLATDPWSETARDVTLVDCTSREPRFNSLYEGLAPKALVVSAYQRVKIIGFTAIGDPTYDYKGDSVIAFQYKSRKINVTNLQVTGFKTAEYDIRIVGGDQRTDDVFISDFVSHESAPNGIGIGGGVYNVNLVNGLLHGSNGITGITSPNTQTNILAVRAYGYTNAAVIGNQKHSVVPNNVKGGFRAATSSGHPLTNYSAIIANTGLTIAKGERNLIAGNAGGATTEGSRNGVMFSYDSHTTGDGASSGVMFSKATKNSKSYSLAMGHGDGSASEANKKIELNAKNGTVRATGAIESVSNLKDLAEYFESADGSKIEASYLVALEGDKVRKAHVGDKILGVVSKTAGVVLGGASFYWNDRYLRDEFGGLVYREVNDGNEILQIPVENPNYKPEAEYKPREERDEWHVIGLIGQVFVRIDETVTVGDSVSAINGVATKAESAGYGTVMKIKIPFDVKKGYGVAQMLVTPQH